MPPAMAQSRATQEAKEVILGIQAALARYRDRKTPYRALTVRNILTLLSAASDSDDSYLQSTNRGNKLKRKAHHMQDTRSGSITGSKAYKRVGSFLRSRQFWLPV